MTAAATVEGVRGAFRLLRRRLLGAAFRRLGASRLRLAVVIVASAVFWALVFSLFREGFGFLAQQQLINQALAEFLFRAFFTSLLAMLALSTGLLIYGSLFSAAESEWLLARPTPADQVFAFKFQEAMYFACWGFVLVGTPMTAAYGVVANAPWTYHALTPLFFLAFALLPGALGAIVCLLLARFAPRRRREFLVVMVSLLAAAAVWLGARVFLATPTESLSRSWLASLLADVAAVDRFVAPAKWIARGLLAASYGGSEGQADAAYNLVLLVANGAAAYLLAAWLYSKWYRAAFDRVRSTGTRGRRRRPAIIVRLAAPFLRPLSRPVRALVEKDLRTFARDPLQWTQASIFVGLLALYVISLGQVNAYARSPYWRTMLATFNLAVVGLMLSTFTSRFIYPLPSLEGRRFWLLGLAPVSRRAVLRGKLYFAAVGGVATTAPLVGLGAVALKWSAAIVLLQMGVAALLAVGLAAIAVGLGAYFASPRETDPSRIASGFGGTVNLVTSLFFLATVIVALGIPAQALALASGASPAAMTEAGPEAPVAPNVPAGGPPDWRWLGLGGLLAGAAGVAAVVAPMRLGLRAFERMEL